MILYVVLLIWSLMGWAATAMVMHSNEEIEEASFLWKLLYVCLCLTWGPFILTKEGLDILAGRLENWKSKD